MAKKTTAVSSNANYLSGHSLRSRRIRLERSETFFLNADESLAFSSSPGIPMRILISATMLFSLLFLPGCGGDDIVPEGPETKSSTAEMTPEETAAEMELQNARRE